MASDSVLTIDGSKFGPAVISEESNAFNKYLMDIMAGGPKWYEVSATFLGFHRHNFLSWASDLNAHTTTIFPGWSATVP